MNEKSLLATNASSLICSAVVENLHGNFSAVYGLDNNMRAFFWRSERHPLEPETAGSSHSQLPAY